MSNLRVWTCRDGTKVRVKDMDDKHLLNTIRMLDRLSESIVDKLWESAGMFQGEMASYYAEAEAEEASKYGVYPSIYYDLVNEMNARKLKLTDKPRYLRAKI